MLYVADLVSTVICIYMSGNNLTGIALHFAKQFLWDAKQLQTIVAENCDAIYLRLQTHAQLSATQRKCIYGTKEWCLYKTLLAQRFISGIVHTQQILR